jgi:hypothetical protein
MIFEGERTRLDLRQMAPRPDGDEEGAFVFDRLPNQIEASEIRAVLGIPKTG